jgi:hypothetical protein
LHLWLLDELESTHLRARGKVGFCSEHEMIDLIFALRDVIEEAHHLSSNVFCSFVDFQKAFDMISGEAFFQRL